MEFKVALDADFLLLLLSLLFCILLIIISKCCRFNIKRTISREFLVKDLFHSFINVFIFLKNSVAKQQQKYYPLLLILIKIDNQRISIISQARYSTIEGILKPGFVLIISNRSNKLLLFVVSLIIKI